MTHSVVTPLLPDIRTPNLYLKCENLQPGGSYKIRGVEVFLKSLAFGIDTVQTLSAGNMARTLALLAQDRGLKVEALVPASIPKVKEEALTKLGVGLSHLPMEELWARVECPVREMGKALLHPIDSSEMLEGYATLAKEILQLEGVEEVVLPFGVGGLCLGVAREIRRHSKKTRIVVAERSDVAPLTHAFSARASVYVPYKKSWVDAIGTPCVLKRVYETILREDLVDEIRCVDPELALDAARELHQKLGIVIEGAAAVSLVAARNKKAHGKSVCILTGGNVSLEILTSPRYFPSIDRVRSENDKTYTERNSFCSSPDGILPPNKIS